MPIKPLSLTLSLITEQHITPNIYTFMRKILLQLFCIACALNLMAQRGEGSDKDLYFNQTTLQVTKAGALEQAFAEASPEKYQGLQVIGPLNDADMRFLAKLAKPSGLDDLHSINLQEAQVERVPAHWLQGFTYVTHVYFPTTLKDVGAYAFAYTNSLCKADLPEGLKSIGQCAFVGTGIRRVNLPASVEKIGEGAFAHLKSLTEVSVPAANNNFDLVDSLLIRNADNTLLQCFKKGTGEVQVPEVVQRVGSLAFGGAKYISAITLPKAVTFVGEDAFASTYALESINVAEGNAQFVSTNGVLFDKGATLLICYPTSKRGNKYTVPATVKELATGAFQECGGGNAYKLINDKAEKKKAKLNEVVLPEGLTKIGKWAFTFTGCQVNIPSTVREIGDSCFYFCEIEEATIPEGVQRIGDGMFAACYRLATITLPSTTTYVGAKVMAYNSLETTLNVYALNPPTCHRDAFAEISGSINLHVVKGKKKAYEKSNDWTGSVFNGIEDDLKAVVTGISAPAVPAADAVETARYNLQGVRIYAPQRGVNIILMSDGTTKKVLVK